MPAPSLRRIAAWQKIANFGIGAALRAVFLKNVRVQGKCLRRLIDAGTLPAELQVAVSGAGALPRLTRCPACVRFG